MTVTTTPYSFHEPRPLANLAVALSKAQQAFGPLVKSKTADAGKYKYDYADLATVFDVVRVGLSNNGLTVTQLVQFDGDRTYLETLLIHDSGELLTSRYPLPSPGSGTPQEMGSAISYSRRYALTSMLGLASEDDDGKAASARKPKPQPAPPKPQAAPKPVLVHTLDFARDAVRRSIATAGISSESAAQISERVAPGVGWNQLTVEQLQAFQKAIETGSVPELTDGAEAPVDTGEGAGDSSPSGAAPVPEPVTNLAAEIRRLGKQTWTPSAEDLKESGNPIEERQVLLDAAANVCLDMKWEDADVIKVLGGNKRNVAKALGQLDIAGLRLAVEAMETAEQAAREGTS